MITENAQNIASIQGVGKNAVLAAIQGASLKTGENFAYLVEKASAESSLNPHLKAKTSSATGLFQFIDNTWLDMIASHGQKHGLSKYAAMIDRKPNGKLDVVDPAMKREILALRKDPKIAALMAAEFTAENRSHLEKNLGGEIGNTELYFAHFLGAKGATRFLSALREDPQAIGAKSFPAAAKANKNVFYNKDGSARALKDIYAFFDRKFDQQPATQIARSIDRPQPTSTKPADERGEQVIEDELVVAQLISDLQARTRSSMSAALGGFYGQGRKIDPMAMMILASIENDLDIFKS